MLSTIKHNSACHSFSVIQVYRALSLLNPAANRNINTILSPDVHSRLQAESDIHVIMLAPTVFEAYRIENGAKLPMCFTKSSLCLLLRRRTSFQVCSFVFHCVHSYWLSAGQLLGIRSYVWAVMQIHKSNVTLSCFLRNGEKNLLDSPLKLNCLFQA